MDSLKEDIQVKIRNLRGASGVLIAIKDAYSLEIQRSEVGRFFKSYPLILIQNHPS